MRIEDVPMLPDHVREDLADEMFAEVCERVTVEHMCTSLRESWRESARAAIELICHALPDYLHPAKIQKYETMRGKWK